jgi:hypothetical protein
MVANEMFLDSASQRDSAVSIAKHLGYTPKSKSASGATIIATLTETNETEAVYTATSVTIPAYSKFEASVNGKSYTFYTMSSYSTTTYVDTTVSPFTRTFTVAGVVLKEGTKLNKQFIVNDASLNAERYKIPNADVDTSTLVVKVKESVGTADSGYETYTKNSGIKDLTSVDLIYFLQEAEDGYYELVFGDDAYGKKLSNGNVISIDYLTTSGKDADGAGVSSGFTATSSTAAWGLTASSVAVNLGVGATVTSSATGGADVESLESIKFTAPLHFQSQNRALTANDYKAIILANYTNVSSIRVWGGEDNARPEYGKVFIVVKPKSGTLLTEQNIIDIKSVVNTYKPIGISVSVKSPDYLYITIGSTVTYNPNTSVETEGTLKGVIISNIMTYNTSNLATFDSIFRYSKLTGIIDDVDVSISSNKTTIGVRQHKAVTSQQLSTSYDVLGDKTEYAYTVGGAINIIFDEIDLKAPITAGTFVSDTFTTLGKVLTELKNTSKTVYYADDGLGKINLLTTGGNLLQAGVGTVDYSTGVVSKLSAINILSIVSTKNYIKFSGNVVNQDIYPENTQIILFEESDVSITMNSETL